MTEDKQASNLNEYRSKARAFFDSLSREEFIRLLEDIGFEVTEGTGQIIELNPTPGN